MEKLKLPIALVLALCAQLAGAVWWVSQQSATLTTLEVTVSELGSRMAIEDNINMKRDVQSNKEEIRELWDETEELWEEVSTTAENMMRIMELQQRIAVVEKTMQFARKDSM
tara:strand:+ start:167 stop:502 length:336 start_codon:yes stop_codon:yes gene_type:complete